MVIAETVVDVTTGTPSSSKSSRSNTTDVITDEDLQKKDYVFDKGTPEFSTMALADVSKSDSDVSYDNVTQVTKDIPLTTPDKAPGNVPQKMSQFEMFAPEFSTMSNAAIAESLVDVTTGTLSSFESYAVANQMLIWTKVSRRRNLCFQALLQSFQP